jgi:hypothetical protein
MGAKELADADQAQAVLDLLQGKGTLAEICNRYGISTSCGGGSWKPSRWRWQARGKDISQ